MSKPKNSKDTIPTTKNSKDDQSKVKNDDDASKIENVASCSGATNSKTTDGGTNSKPDIGTNSKPDGAPKLCKTISSDKKDVNEIVTESRPREMGIHGDGVPHSKGYGRSEFKSASSDSKPCLVDNCERDGGFFEVCEGHMWSFGVSVNGKPSRYCHSCYVFQNVEDFDAAGRHICKKATETSKNDALAIPTRTGLMKISMGPSLKDTSNSKEDLLGSKFKGDGLNENADSDSKPCQVDNCNVDGGLYGACATHKCSSDVSVKGKPMKFCQTCMMFQNISDFDPGSLICKSQATVDNETPEKDAPSKLLKLTEEMHSNIADLGTQLVRLAEDTERMQKEIEQTQQLVLKGKNKLCEVVRTSNKRLREDMERRYTSLQKSLGK